MAKKHLQNTSKQLLEDIDLPIENVELEKSIISAIFERNEYLSICQDIFKSNNVFYSEFNTQIYQCLIDFEDNFSYLEIIDIISISHVYKSKFGEDCRKELSSILISKPLQIPFKQACFILLEIYIRRYTKDFSNKLNQRCSDLTSDVFENLDFINDFSVNTSDVINSTKKVSLKSDIDNLLNSFGKPSEKVYSGVYLVDEIYKGFQEGTLTIMAGRPAMGKTAVACQFIMNMAIIQNKKVAFISLEMTKSQILKRLLSNYTGFTNSEINSFDSETCDKYNLDRFISEANTFPTANIEIYDSSSRASELSVLVSIIKKLHKDGCKCIVIDYLQLIEDRSNKKVENRNQEISVVSRRLKLLSTSLKIPIIALAQLSREVEKRGNKKPIMSDIRESGSIEQDADNIIMLYREWYYEQTDYSKEKVLTLIPVKNRNGVSNNEGFDVEIDLSVNRLK